MNAPVKRAASAAESAGAGPKGVNAFAGPEDEKGRVTGRADEKAPATAAASSRPQGGASEARVRKDAGVSEALRVQAVGFDACQKGLRAWTDDLDALCELYFRHIDFCIEHQYPDNGFLKEHFGGVMQRHGLYVDEVVDARSQRLVSCNGTTTGRIRYGGYDVATVYVRHDSDVEICAGENACVQVRVHDRARVRVAQSGGARIAVFRYGGDCAADCIGEVECING